MGQVDALQMRQIFRDCVAQTLVSGLTQQWHEFAQHVAGRYQPDAIAALRCNSAVDVVRQLT